jgi:Cys-tRNA(Pro)/Cys-tRNA(Cys) deacylase
MGKAKKDKDIKTNAMRFLDSKKIAYSVNTYECEDFVDGVHIAQMLGQDEDMSYKTLVTKGKGGGYFVFVLPVARELDMKKAAKAVGEKSVEMLHVKDINAVTGYIRGGCSPLEMKKQFPTVVDESAQVFETIIISGGRLGSQIILAPTDLVNACGGCFAAIVQ